MDKYYKSLEVADDVKLGIVSIEMYDAYYNELYTLECPCDTCGERLNLFPSINFNIEISERIRYIRLVGDSEYVEIKRIPGIDSWVYDGEFMYVPS